MITAGEKEIWNLFSNY